MFFCPLFKWQFRLQTASFSSPSSVSPFDMASILENQKLSLIGCGLLPLDCRSSLPHVSPKLIFLLNNSLVAFCCLNSLHILTFLFYALFFTTGCSFEERMTQLQDFFGQFSAAVYLVVYMVKRKPIQQTIAMVEKELPFRSLAGIVYLDMGDCVKRSRKITNWLAISFVIGTIFHGFLPLLRGQAYKAHPFHTVYPSAWAYKSPGYEILYTIQMVGQIHLGWQYAAFMTLFVSVARMMTAQYEMLLCSIRNVVNSAMLQRGNTVSQALLRKALGKWRQTIKVGKEYNECVEVVEPSLDDEDRREVLGSYVEDVLDESDPFHCGEYDEEVLVAIIAFAKRQALILKICTAVEDILQFNMLNTIGVMVSVICILIYACSTIGQVNESSADFANYLILSFFEMFIMCYYPHMMSYQVRE